MKKILLTLALTLVASSSFATLSGTKHDLSVGTYKNVTAGQPGDQLCRYCHVPHNAVVATSLWARTNGTAVGTYVNTASMNATAGAVSDPGSTACMSCHAATQTTGGNTMAMAIDIPSTSTKIINTAAAAVAGVGGDLSNDHPIGFVYNAALATADGGLFSPASANKVTRGTITLPLFGAGSLECASCHAVHGTTTSNYMFLRTTNTGSQLCLVCHNK